MLCARVRACVRAYLTPLKHGHKESSIFCPRYFTIFYLQFVICPQAPPPPPRPPTPPPPRGIPGGCQFQFQFSVLCPPRGCAPLKGGTEYKLQFQFSIFCAVLCARVRACVHPLSTGTRRVINFTISIFNFAVQALPPPPVQACHPLTPPPVPGGCQAGGGGGCAPLKQFKL